MGWFGSMGLAYKYFLVFGILLFTTIAAGLIKVYFDKQKLKKLQALQTDSVVRDDQVELNQREKDEGDLFGVRALEAGYFAGIAQSRPTSAAGSYVGTPSMSTNTLIGSSDSPKIPAYTPGSSVTSLPLAHTNGRDSGDPSQSLLSPNIPSTQRKDPPTIRLAPSEAELSGRINHSVPVNMNLAVPPSPVLAKGPKPQTFNGDDDESDGNLTPRSLSPRSPTFETTLKPNYYSPQAPQIPMPEGLTAGVRSVTTPENAGPYRSQAASLQDNSPNNSTPPSPGPPPTVQPPSIPTSIQVDSPTDAPYQAYNPVHTRDASDASSLYSQENRRSMMQRNRSDSAESGIAYNYSAPERSTRNSISLSADSRDQSRRPSGASSLAPSSAISTDTQSTHDPRFSEFYDSYYRQSQYGTATKTDVSKRPKDLNMTQPTIVEVPSPLPSPAANNNGGQHFPGMAM